MNTLVKTSLKLLFRTKAFWFFLFLAPLLSTVVLKSKFDSSFAYTDSSKEEIIELETIDEKAAYHGNNGEYVVKAYDASGSELSEYFLNKLAKSGLFTVCRVDLTDRKDESKDIAEGHLKKDGYEDRMGAAIYLSPDFDQYVSEQNAKEALTIYELSDDKRTEVLLNEIAFQLSRMENGEEFLKETDDSIPEKNIVRVAGASGRSLSKQQINQKTQMGYALAFLTLGFVFCGIFVSHTVIKEQGNGVLTRIGLSNTSTIKYFCSKFLTVLVVSAMVTAVMGICSLMLHTDDLGMNRLQFIGMIFLMGLIFSSISMLFGMVAGDVMTANVAAFVVWSMSSLLSGLYFPLAYTSKALKVLSFSMPQKWFMEGTEMIFVGDNKVYLMLLCITVSYLAVIISFGSLAMKIKRTE